MKTAYVILTSLLFFSLPSFAGPQGIRYQDESGQTWTRWVMTDKRLDGTLLLVVDEPAASPRGEEILQKVVFKKFFGEGKGPQLNRAKETYSRLIDRQQPKIGESEIIIQTGNPIWEVERTQWTLEDEENFSKWFKETVNLDFFENSGIEVDCADFAIAARWIFAHDHRLPVANTLAGSGRLFGHWSGTRTWDRLPTHPSWKSDQRFKAALRYILDNAFTHSIIGDLYPVVIGPEWITAGSIDLVLYSEDTGHTQVVWGIEKDEDNCDGKPCLMVMWGNEPAAETIYYRRAWIVNNKRGKGGFLRWRWPKLVNDQWTLTPAAQMPGYSLEQYNHPEMSDDRFESYIYENIGIFYTPGQKAIMAGYDVENSISYRKSVIAHGYFLCSIQLCEPGSDLYEAYSTPSRDRRMRAQQQLFVELARVVPADDEDFSNYLDDIERRIPLIGVPLTIKNLMFNEGGAMDRLDSDPRSSFFERWGLRNLDESAQLMGLVHAWGETWYLRDDFIYRAQAVCFDYGNRDTPNCRQSAPEVQSLNTARLDQSFRVVRETIREIFNRAPQQAQNQAIEYSRSFQDWFVYCGGGRRCTAFDFIFSNNEYVQTMSSQTWDPLLMRFGMEP